MHVGKHKERVLSFAFSRVKAFAKSLDVTTRLNAKMNSREKLSPFGLTQMWNHFYYTHTWEHCIKVSRQRTIDKPDVETKKGCTRILTIKKFVDVSTSLKIVEASTLTLFLDKFSANNLSILYYCL